MLRESGGGVSTVHQRQHYHHLRSAAAALLCGDRAPVGLDDGACQGETESGVVRSGVVIRSIAEKAAEYSVPVLVRNARSLVGNGHIGRFGVGFESDRDSSALGREADCVVDQVFEGLGEAVGGSKYNDVGTRQREIEMESRVGVAQVEALDKGV